MNDNMFSNTPKQAVDALIRLHKTANEAQADSAKPEAGSEAPITQQEINDYLKSQGQDPTTLADAFRPGIEKAIRERQKILGQLIAPVGQQELEWAFGFDGALACLELVANGLTWQSWQQHRTDTRGIVTERAGKYLRKQQADLAAAREQVARLRAALEPFASSGKSLEIIERLGNVEDFDYHMHGLHLKLSDFKQAAAVLAGDEGGA